MKEIILTIIFNNVPDNEEKLVIIGMDGDIAINIATDVFDADIFDTDRAFYKKGKNLIWKYSFTSDSDVIDYSEQQMIKDITHHIRLYSTGTVDVYVTSIPLVPLIADINSFIRDSVGDKNLILTRMHKLSGSGKKRVARYFLSDEYVNTHIPELYTQEKFDLMLEAGFEPQMLYKAANYKIKPFIKLWKQRWKDTITYMVDNQLNTERGLPKTVSDYLGFGRTTRRTTRRGSR